jgi:hypothetical protein
MKWKFILPLLVGVFFVLIQGLVAVYQPLISQSLPNLILLCSVYFSFFYPSLSAVVIVFLLGLISDFSSHSFIVGPSSAGLLSVFVVLFLLSPNLYIESSFSLFILVFLSSIGMDTFYSFITLRSAGNLLDSFGIILLRGIITALCAPFVFRRAKFFYGLDRQNTKSIYYSSSQK